MDARRRAQPRARDLAAATPAHRERYIDLLRAASICVVVLGHWTVWSVTAVDEDLRGTNLLSEVPGTHPLTWVFQVVPVFLLVGGYANAASLVAERRRGRDTAAWVRQRALRLLRPSAVLVLVLLGARLVVVPLGVSEELVRTAIRVVAGPLWFLAGARRAGRPRVHRHPWHRAAGRRDPGGRAGRGCGRLHGPPQGGRAASRVAVAGGNSTGFAGGQARAGLCPPRWTSLDGVTDAPTPRVVSCGLATLDVIQYVERLPSADEKIVASASLVEAGGPALNAAMTARVLGCDSALVTAIGTGAIADAVRADLRRVGVEVIDLAPADAAPPLSSVLVTAGTGDRAVVSTNAAGMEAISLSDGAALDGVHAVLVDGHHLGLCLEVAQAARARGVPVLLDGGSWKPGTGELLELVDVAAVSSDFTPGGEPVTDLSQVCALGPRWAIRTRGGRSVQVYDASAGRMVEVDVPPVEVVDTLGAGDVFHGALLAHLARGPLDAPAVLAATRYAIRVAGASVRAAGAHGWFATVRVP